MRLGIDIDGTINLLADRLNILAKRFNANTRHRGRGVAGSFDIADANGWTKVQTTAFWEEYGNEAYITAEPMRNVSVMLNKLHSEGNSLYFITKRSASYKGVYEVTNAWLIAYNIPYTDIFMGSDNKLMIANNLAIDIFVEDNVDNALQIASGGIQVIVPEWDYNAELAKWNPLIHRVRKDWEMIYSMIHTISRET